MINYEDKIDSLNENTELAFYENALECIGLNEGIDIKGKVEAAKKAVVNFFKNIREKITKFIDKIKAKWKNSKLKAKLDKIGAKIKGKDGAEIAKKASAKYISGNKSVEKGGSEATGTSLTFVKYADFGISYHPIDDSAVNKILAAQDDGIDAMVKINGEVRRPSAYNENLKDITSKYMSKLNGIADKDGNMNMTNLKASLISSREQKLANINMAALNTVGNDISKAQQAMDASATKAAKFDKSCAAAQGAIDQIKVEYFDSNDKFNGFKSLCNQSINVTRSVFNNLTTVIKSLSQYITQMYGVLDRIDAVCTTYNITDDSIR